MRSFLRSLEQSVHHRWTGKEPPESEGLCHLFHSWENLIGTIRKTEKRESGSQDALAISNGTRDVPREQNESDLQTLEFDKILALLANCALSSAGRETNEAVCL